MNQIIWQKLLFLALVPSLFPLPSVYASNITIQGKRTIAQSFEPPPEDPPREIQDSGGRPADSCMPTSEKYPIVLIPKLTGDRLGETREPPLISWGLTLETSPPLFVYIPETTVQEAEVQIWQQQPDNKRPKLVYREQLSLPDRPGIVQINVSKDSESILETGHLYEWNLKILCDRFNRSQNPRSGGFIERIEPRENSRTELDNIQPETLHAWYASQGIWYDALANLVQQRRSRPNDETLEQNWHDLLTSVGLDHLIDKPILDCCELADLEE